MVSVPRILANGPLVQPLELTPTTAGPKFAGLFGRFPSISPPLTCKQNYCLGSKAPCNPNTMAVVQTPCGVNDTCTQYICIGTSQAKCCQQ